MMKIRVKEKTKVVEKEVEIVEMMAGDVPSIDPDNSDHRFFTFAAIASSILSKNGKVFADAEDVKKRLSARSFSAVAKAVNDANGFDEEEGKNG